jgi:hypothetical protein
MNYKTSDIYLASFLVASSCSKLIAISDNGFGRKIFIFDTRPTDEKILGFYNATEKVSAVKLFEAFQTLKSATYVVDNKREG